MHEISLVKNIFKILEDEFPGQMDKVRQIHLTVGLLSNVQPILIQSAFEAVLQAELQYNNISLTVEVLPVLIHCSECGKITQVKDYEFVCSCGKPSSNIVQGEELMIRQIVFAGEDEVAFHQAS